MLKPARLFIILIVLALAINVHANKLIIGKVVGVTDGDTIKVLENHTLYKIRLLPPVWCSGNRSKACQPDCGPNAIINPKFIKNMDHVAFHRMGTDR